MPRPITPTLSFSIGLSAQPIIDPPGVSRKPLLMQPAAAAVMPIQAVPLRKSLRVLSMSVVSFRLMVIV